MLLSTLNTLYNKIRIFFKIKFILLDKRITIGKNINIEKNAKIKIVNGGEILIQDNLELKEGVLILTYGGIIKIGNNCNINPYTVIYGHGGTTIGNDVLIAGHCMIIPNNHKFKKIDKTIKSQGNESKGIIIEDDVWIAHGCSILDGVIIGKGSVIAAGSVVTRNIPPYSIYGGIPAKFIKKRKSK